MTGTPCRAAADRARRRSRSPGERRRPRRSAWCRSLPGPMPALTASAPGVDQRLGRLGRRDVAGDELDVAETPFRFRTISSTPREWPCAVSTTSTSAPAATSACGALDRVAARRRPRRRRAAGRARPCVACGYSIRFWMSLTVIRPLRTPLLVDDRQLLDLVAVQDRLRLRRASSRPARSRGRGRHQLRDRAPTSFSKRRSRLVRIPTRTPLLVGDRHARDVVALHQLERVGDERRRRQRHRLDDHPRLRALDLVDLGRPGRRSRGCGGRCRSRPRARARSRGAPR